MYKIILFISVLFLMFSCKTSNATCDAYGQNINNYQKDSTTFKSR